jgi:hypothetical protein
MPVTPLDPPDATQDPFISQQDLTNYLGRNVNSDDGALFAVQAACEVVRGLAERQFNRGTATYALDGSGTDALLLPDLPVNSAGTVLVNGGTVTDYTLNGNGILFRGTAGVEPRPLWPRGRQNVVVTADHGYSAVDIPQDVKMVALNLAARIIVQGVAVEEQIGTARVKYAGAAMDLTAGEKAILQKYRQHR